ncbi:MAG: ABC transporter permease [Acidimicrobiia bacterium]|nr:ABC transporter permease [Acidimicrobiia bacterium]
MGGLGAVLGGAGRVWSRDATVYRHVAKWLLIPNFLDPVLFLVALGLGLGTYLTGVEGIPYIDFIAPGLLASSTMYTASFETTWNITWKIDMNQTYDAVIATPVDPQDIVVGEVLGGGTRAALTGVVFLAVIATFGLVHSWWGVLMPFVVALVGLVFAATGVLTAVHVSSTAFWGYYYTLFVTPMFLLSGVFFPIERLNGWVQAIAWCLPLFHGVRLLRGMSLGDPVAFWWVSVLYLMVLPVVLVIPAGRSLRRRLMT